MSRVTLALLGARAAGSCTRAEERLEGLGVPGADGQRTGECFAGSRADPVEPDAGGELGDIVLGQARVGAGRAGLGAIEARVDTARDRVRIETGTFPARREQLAGVAHC